MPPKASTWISIGKHFAARNRVGRTWIISSVRKTGKCLIVHEDNRFGGFGAEIAALVAEEAFDYLDGPVTRLAGPESPAAPYASVLEDAFLITPEKIATAIRTLAAY